jgi:hypothetical protein
MTALSPLRTTIPSATSVKEGVEQTFTALRINEVCAPQTQSLATFPSGVDQLHLGSQINTNA